MKISKTVVQSLTALLITSAPALAQAATKTAAHTNAATNNVGSKELPPPQSDHDAKPMAPKLDIPSEGITQQAGIGGTQAYGRVGVMELGGSLAFNSTTNYTFFSMRPTVGYFFMDNWELSAIMAWNQYKVDGTSGGTFGLMLEPSIHLPINDSLFGFVGAGIGLSAAKHSDVGAAVGARVGLNIMVGRSGVLSPEINTQYSTNHAVATSQGTLLAVNSSFGFGAGYTVMW